MQWSFILDGQQYDPVDEETILSYLQSGQIAPDTLVWQEGMPEWVPAKIAFAMQLNTGPAGAARPSEQAVPISRVREWPTIIAVIILLMAIGYTLSGLFTIIFGAGAIDRQIGEMGEMGEMVGGVKSKVVATGVFACLTGILGFFGAISLFRKQYSSGGLIVMFSYVLIAYLIVELLVSLSISSDIVAAIKASTGRSIDLAARNGFKILFRLAYLAVPSFFILWFSRKEVRST